MRAQASHVGVEKNTVTVLIPELKINNLRRQ